MPRNVKEIRREGQTRGWIPKPILGSEFTEDLPLQDAYVGLLKQKKDISTAIQSISRILPGLGHLKRCSSNRLLLMPLPSSIAQSNQEKELPTNNNSRTEDKLKTFLIEKGFDLSLLEDKLQVLKVPARAPRTKTQAAAASKIWPVNFHPDPHVEGLINGSVLDEQQLESIENHMNLAIQVAKLAAVGNANCNGSAIIVDPGTGRILAVAASRIHEHPMWHAAMLAVDLVAKSQGGGAWKLGEGEGKSVLRKLEASADESELPGSPTLKQKGESIKRKYQDEAPFYYPVSLPKVSLPPQEPLHPRNTTEQKVHEDEGVDPTHSKKSGPYLCTGYWVVMLSEPCPLCAMALLHSRVARIFYGAANRNAGVLGSKAVLHAVPGLNHRYQVWGAVLEKECEEVTRQIEHRNVS